MHRSIGGLADSFQSIADGKASLNSKKKKQSRQQKVDEVATELESSSKDVESNKRMNDANMHYFDMECCTARIAARLRDIDNIDLNNHPLLDFGDTAISNQMKFIDDQCYRAQSLLNGDYYMRNLHSEEVHKNMIELDERINFTAKNWKHALVEMGIQENELTELKAPAVEAAEDLRPVESDSKKVRRNSVMTQARATIVATEADYSNYNAAEFNELNEIIKQFMDQAFVSGTNGVQISKEVMDRCNKFKLKFMDLTNQLVEKQKVTIRSALRDAQKIARSQESEIALLHTQNEDADMVIRNQKESDKQIRRLVEAKFADSIRKIRDHIQGIDDKLEAQEEVNGGIQKRFLEVQGMFDDLSKQRLYTDPFLRRRAENLVKGLLRNLNESELKEQEEREEQMQSSYQQWKKIIEFCADKERQLGLMDAQEQILRDELEAQKRRIEEERISYRDKAKVLTGKDTEQSNKLLILEEQISDRARDERRKLHVEHREGSRPASQQQGDRPLKVKNPGGDDFSDSDSVWSGRGTKPASPNRSPLSQLGPTSPTSPISLRDAASGSDSESSSVSSIAEGASPTVLHDKVVKSSKVKQSSRVKQRGLRTVTSLVDDYTEGILGITYEHTKRQEISINVHDHIPRPAPGHITGSEASDNALLAKAQKIMSTLHPVAPASTITAPLSTELVLKESSVALVPPPHDEPWSFGTNSSHKTPNNVKFGSPGQRQSTLSNNSLKQGYWDEVEGGALEESSSEGEPGRGRQLSASRKGRALEVFSLSSTACYVSLYFRYLKKFPNLNFKRSNPRLEAPSSLQLGDNVGSIDQQGDPRAHKKTSELVKDNSRFQFSIREAVIVIKEALDSLLQCRCIDKIIVTDALEKMAELERRVKVGLSEEEKEVRYQLHFLCVSLIHTTLTRAPRTLLVKNNRKYFVEISTTMLALLGVVLNCTLVFWQPSALDKASRRIRLGAEGGIAAERVEFICAHLIELVITLGDVDSDKSLSSGRSSPPPRRASAINASRTFKTKKTADTPPGPAGFISLLRTQASELLCKRQEGTDKPPPSPSRAGSKSPFSGQKGIGIDYHDLFDVFRKIVDEDAPIDSSEGTGFTIKHRHAILSLQLFLYLALNNSEVTMDEAILTLHKGIIDGNNCVRADASNVIPCDVDILLQQMHPGMVPAVLVLELIRRVLEEEFHRVGFLEKIANSDKDVSDLQFLNVQFSSQFDVGLKKGREEDSSNNSYLSQSSTALTTLSPQLSTVDARVPAPKRLANELILGHQPAPVAEKQIPPMHISHFKTTKEVHLQWVEDLQLHLRHLGEEIASLIRPTIVGQHEPTFVSSRTPTQAESVPKTAAIPLPDVLVYKILGHINNLKNITTSRSVTGLSRVQALQPVFLQIMRELFAARSKIIAIVTAMTWPMRKKIDWLKLKYNTILEENGATNDQVADYQELVERYQRDIDAYKTSIQLIDKEKHTLEYRRTKMLMLDHHDPQIQQLIIEHATDEYSSKYTDFKTRESRLTTTIDHLSHEYDHLSAQHDTLKAAQRSLNLIDEAQDTLETELLNSPLHTGEDFNAENTDQEKPLTAQDFELNLRLTPKIPPVMAQMTNAVDDFMQRERLAEIIPEDALRDGMPRDSISAKQVEERARTSELQRLREKRRAESAQSRPRMPLFGAPMVLTPRPEQPSLSAKLFGFAKRIDSGLQAVGALRSNVSQKTPNTGTSLKINTTFSTSASEKFDANPDTNMLTSQKVGSNLNTFTDTTTASSFSQFLNEKSTDTATSDLDLGSYMSTAQDSNTKVHTEDGAGLDNFADMFGQPTPISLRERIERGYLRKHSNAKAKSGKMKKVINQFMWRNANKGAYNHAETLAGPPPDSPLLTTDPLGPLTVEGEHVAGGLAKKPDLEKKKNHVFLSALDRVQPFRYDEIVEHDIKTNFTPLNIRKMINTLREEQSEEMASRRALSPYVDLLPASTSAGSDRGIGSAFRPGSGIEYDDMYEEFDDEDFEQDLANGTDGVSRFHKAHPRGGSNRDQNAHNGVTYAEYLVWKTKRKQQQHGAQPLEALKNSINIQLRSARRVYAADVDEQDEEPLPEELSTKGTGDDDLSLDEENEVSSHRDYSKSNSEVNFILSRSGSRADFIAAKKRKHSSQRSPSVGSSLHFNSTTFDSDSSALVEAEGRARGENVPSARASLSIRSRASLIGKLSRALDGMEDQSETLDQAFPSPGTRTARSSVARQSMVRPLATIIERRTSQARGSMYKPTTAPAPSESKLEEARVLAHSIIHGRVLDSPKHKTAKSFEKASSNFDMQILDYIANDHLIIKGWESVDLLKMNDNETFAGHSFKFDDQEERLRISTLKEFTKQVASNAESSANRVESEFKDAIMTLNRLVGKKNTDIAEIEAMTSARELALSQPPSAEKSALMEESNITDSGTLESEENAAVTSQVHHNAVYKLWPSSTDRLDSPESPDASRLASPEALGYLRSDSTIGFPHSASQSGLQIATTRVTFSEMGLDVASEEPHRPSEPKPSVPFSSPHRKSKISESKY